MLSSLEQIEMTRCNDASKLRKAKWSAPELVQLTVDLTAIAGNAFPPGDNKISNGKSATPS